MHPLITLLAHFQRPFHQLLREGPKRLFLLRQSNRADISSVDFAPGPVIKEPFRSKRRFKGQRRTGISRFFYQCPEANIVEQNPAATSKARRNSKEIE